MNEEDSYLSVATTIRDALWWKENFGRLDTLKIYHLNTASTNVAIYGNGRNAAPVLINMRVFDKNNKPITLTNDDLLQMTGLCHYNTGIDLFIDISPPSGWVYSGRPGDYVKPIISNSINNHQANEVDNDHRNVVQELSQCIWYVSSNNEGESALISAFINIPGIGKFNTSRNPTNTPNGPIGGGGSPFKAESFIPLKSLNRVDYSKPENISIIGAWKTYSDLSEVVTDMKVTVSGPKPDFYGGKSSKANLKIYPKSPASQFIVKRVSGNNASLGRLDIKGRGGSNSADIVRGVGGDNHDATLIFIEASGQIGVSKGAFSLTGESSPYTWTYHIGDNDCRHYINNNSIAPYYVDVRLFNHRVPRASLRQDGWSDSADTATVYVVDDFGNDGTISVRLDESIWPRLRINTNADW